MRPVRLTSSLVAAPVVALVLAFTAACTAQTSTPEEAARQLVKSALDQDGEAFCELVASNGELPDEETKKECVDGLSDETFDMEDEERKNMEHFLEEGAEKVEEDGDKATVTLKGEEPLRFVKIDDAWYWDPLA